MIFRNLVLYFVCLLLLALSPTSIYAQSECGNLLRQAQRSFDTGHPQEALTLINECIAQNRFTRNEALQAYRLITIIHLLENDPRADESFKKLLKLNPEFRVDYDSLNADPGELVFLYENFRTDPLVNLRIYAGTNRTEVNETEVFDISPDPENTKVYRQEYGYQVGLQVGIPLFNRNIRLNVGAEFAQIGYSLTNEFNAFGPHSNLPAGRDDSPDFFVIRLSEFQQVVNIPVLLEVNIDRWSKYNFERNKFVPFLYGGISYQYLLSASFPEVSTESRTGNFLSSSSFANGKIDPLRNKTNLSIVLGGGFKLKVFRNYLTVEANYRQGLRNVVNADLRYDNAELVHGFGHLDSDFRFNTLMLSVGYEVPIYVPKRRKIR